MSDLNTARRRLEDSVSKLEAAVASSRPPSDGEAGLMRELAALRAECERLNEALAKAHEERGAVREASERVAERLDGTIAELDSILEG